MPSGRFIINTHRAVPRPGPPSIIPPGDVVIDLWAMQTMRVIQEDRPKTGSAITMPAGYSTSNTAFINEAGVDKVYAWGARNQIASVALVLEPSSSVSGLSVEMDTLTRSGGSETITSPVRGVVTGSDVFKYYDAAWSPRPRRDIEILVAHYTQIRAISSFGNGFFDEWTSGGGGAYEIEGPWYLRRPYNPTTGVKNVGTAWVDRPAAMKYMPDILIPHEVVNYGTPQVGTFSIPAGKSQMIVVRVMIPTGQAVGTYTGTLTIKQDGVSVKTIPFKLDVNSLTLPADQQVTNWFLSEAWQTGTARYLTWNEFHAPHAAFVANQRKLYTQAMWRYGITPIWQETCDLNGDAENQAYMAGTPLTNAQGYAGPNEGVGPKIWVHGPFGSFGWGKWQGPIGFTDASNNWYQVRSLTAGNPSTVTVDDPHGLSNGTTLTLRNGTGSWAGNPSGTITSTGTRTFTITINSTGWGNYAPFDRDSNLAFIGSASTGTTTTFNTKSAHGFTTGQWKRFSGMPTGWTSLNGKAYAVTVVDSDTFTIAFNSTGFPAYTDWATGASSGWCGSGLAQTALDDYSTMYTYLGTNYPSIKKFLYLIDEPGYDQYFKMQMMVDRIRADAGSINAVDIFIAANGSHIRFGDVSNGNFGVRGIQYLAATPSSTDTAWWEALGVEFLPYNQPNGCRANGEGEATAFRTVPWHFIKRNRSTFFCYASINMVPTDFLNKPSRSYSSYRTQYYSEIFPVKGEYYKQAYLNIADQNPLSDSGQWTTVNLPGQTTAKLYVTSERAYGNLANEWNFAYFTNAAFTDQYGRNHVTSCKGVGLASNKKVAMAARCSGNGATFKCYAAEFDNGTVTIVKYVDGVRSVLATAACDAPNARYLTFHAFDFVEKWPGIKPYLLARIDKTYALGCYDNSGTTIDTGVPGIGIFPQDTTTYLETKSPTSSPFVNDTENSLQPCRFEDNLSPEECGDGGDSFTRMANYGSKPAYTGNPTHQADNGPDYSSTAFNGTTNRDGLYFFHSYHRRWPFSGLPGLDGPLASLRALFLYEGYVDAQYYKLAKAVNATSANAELDVIVPDGGHEYSTRDVTTLEYKWPINPDTFDARRVNLKTIAGG